MSSIPGYAGRILRVDLSGGRTVSQSQEPALARKFLGGTGFGAYVLWEEVPAGVEWADPQNRIIFASGPLSGTRVKGSSTISVVTKGAITRGAAATQANGYFSAFLKFAGFDAVVVEGRADRLSYLYVHDGTAEIRDARHLAGKDTWETEDLIKDELALSSAAASVLCIGPAGENLVRFGGVFCDHGHAAAHNGPGAVMGAKNLKAIAVARGSGRLPVYDDPRLSQLANRLFDITKTDSYYQTLYKWGTLWILESGAHTGRVPYKNYTTNVCPMTPEQLKTFGPEYLREHYDTVRKHPCWACQMNHCTVIRLQEGPLTGKEGEEPEFEGYTSVGTQLGIFDWRAVTALANEVDRLGMDVNETGWVMGLVMECYEKGLLTKQQTDGIDLSWGNVDGVRAMINRIARKQGFGAVLAEGAMRAAQRIGGAAPQMAVHTMAGNTPLGHDHRANWPYMFDVSMANTGCYELHLSPRAANLGLKDIDPNSPQQIAWWVATVKWVAPFFDSLGICRLANREFPELLVGLLNAATGWDFTQEEAKTVGLRIINLLRAFNFRHGHTPELERPSPRYGSIPVDGPHKGRNVAPFWEEMRDAYYRELGWDRTTGKPLPETLKGLGLEAAASELWLAAK